MKKRKKSIEIEAYLNQEAVPAEYETLTVRTVNALTKAKITTMDELAALTEKELKKIRNLGNRCFELAVYMREKYASETNQD
jgi:DNA-directed RNA polymerase alpha subunit